MGPPSTIERILPWASLAVLLVAGCAAPAPAPTEALAFGPGVVVDEGLDASEPFVVTAPEGALFVSAMPGNTDERPYGLGEVSRLWRSDDDGATWSRLAPHAPIAGERGAGGGDSAIAISPQGTIFVSDLYGAQIEASTSTDGGATWTRAPVASPMPYLDRQWMAAGLDGRGYILARSFFPGVAMWVLRSDDEGATWDLVGQAWRAEPGSSLAALTSNVVVHPRDGSLHTLFGCSADGRLLCLASSRDAGATWTQSRIVESPAPVGDIFPSLAAGPDGALHAAWISHDAQGRALWVASSANSRTWSEPERVPLANGTFVFPAIVASQDSRIAVAYYSADGAFDPNDVEATRGAEWRVEVALRDAAGAWQRAVATAAPVHRGSLSTVGAAPSPDAPDWTLGDLLSLTLDRDGRLVVAFTTGTEGTAPPRAAVARQSQGPLLSEA